MAGVLLLAPLLGLPLALPPAATAAESDEALLRIGKPRPNHLFRTRPARLPVRIQAPRGARVRATVNGRTVGLHRKRGDVRTARATVRGTGPAVLRVRAKRRGEVDIDAVRVLMGRERSGLVRAATAGRASGSARVALRLRRPEHRLLVWLNGRPVHRMFRSRPWSRSRRARLSVRDGLRFGRNRLRVVAFRDDGRYTRLVRSFVISRQRPLAGTGRDRQIRRGQLVRLRARASPATRSGRRLTYRWRLVGQPAGSRASLRGAGRARPRLRPDRHGLYRIRLTVRERAGLRAGNRATGSAAPRVATDTQRVVAFPTDPLGLSLEVKPGAIVLGGDSYPNPAATVQLLSVNRENATVTPSKSFTRDRSGMEKLDSAIEDLSKGQLAVVAASPAKPAVASDAVDSLNGAIARIGARPLAKSLLANDAGFSVVGVRGSDAGSAYVNPDVPAPDGAGTISGYLQPYESETATKLLAYVPSEYHIFDTGGDNGSGQATITIGTDRYVGSLPSGQAGFLVVTLEGGVADSQVYRTNGAGRDITDQGSLAAKLLFVAPDPNQLVFLQSIGKPRPTTANWEGIGQAVAQMKGDPTAVNTLDGKTDYAFVGGSGVDDAAQATSASGLPGRLSGVLGRSRSFHLQPLLSDSSAVPDYSLLPIVFQEPQQWPTPGGPTVLKYISNQLTKNDKNPTDDIRTEYGGSMHDFLTDLDGVNCARVPNVDETDCNDLKTELAKEFQWVDSVHDFTGGIKQALVVATETESTDLLPMAKATVEKSLAVPAAAKAVGEALDFVSDIVSLIEAVPVPPAAPTSPVPEEEEGPMGGIASIFQLVGDAASDLPGDPLLGEIEAEAEKLDQALAKNLYQLHAQLDTIDEILVEDYGKLEAVGSAADAGEPFNWDSNVDQTATAQLTQAALQWFYGSLLPIGYDLAQLTPGERNPPGTGTDAYTCQTVVNNRFVNVKWFEGTPAAAQFPYVTALNPNGSPKTPTVWTLAKKDPSGVFNGAAAPSGGLVNALFGPPEANGLGLYAPFFLPRYLKPLPYGC